MEKLQKQIEVSIEERMNELMRASKRFIEEQSAEPKFIAFSSMTYMRDMINDVENLLKMSSSISYRQELSNMDDFEKEVFLEEHFESQVDELEREARYGYANFLEERSFEDD